MNNYKKQVFNQFLFLSLYFIYNGKRLVSSRKSNNEKESWNEIQRGIKEGKADL